MSLRAPSCSKLAAAGVVSSMRFRALRSILPEEKSRQRFDDLEPRGDHVGWQSFAQFRSQFARVIEWSIAREKGHEFVDPVFLAQHDGGLAHMALLAERRLDFAELDAKAAYLDLIVDAAMKAQIAGFVEDDGVARTIKYRVGTVRIERIGNEFFRREFVALQVAARDAWAANEQLALNSVRKELQGLARHITTVVGNGTSDRHRLFRTDLRDRRDHRGLARAIAIVNLAAATHPTLRQGGRTGLAAEDDGLQGLHVVRQHGEQGGDRIEHGDAGFLENVGQGFRLADDLRRRDK